MTGLAYDPEYAKVIEPFANSPRSAPPSTALEMRPGTDLFLSSFMPKFVPGGKVQQTIFTIKSYDGAELRLYRLATPEHIAASTPQPAVLATHGGGLAAGSAEVSLGMYAQDVLNGDRPVFAIGYRLAPEHPAPTAAEDAFAAFKYLSEHAKELNIDPARIAVKGESAGGTHAAAVALIARDREFSPAPAKLIMVYPMLDDRTNPPADSGFLKLASWSPHQNKLGWGAYIGEDNVGKPDANIPAYAVPARAKSLKGLPSTYIDIGSLDLFRDESLEFAQRLMREDVEVEFHLFPGVPHAFDLVAPGTKWQLRALEARTAALKSF
ncbi:hypothetical protein G7Z17_g2812 [Cylindrodendrum hubeiense]|uniref:Alpha/beta hydrolase fold-3 domain-containing protein n=1 Tax=Cylindrodendrum hubeiense TaxID=595255 RepID=A0A9P5LKP3_9HYPO|nr:hypothetical protein G7Z17_g2812 [Cylindrodendrum hubeiense]